MAYLLNMYCLKMKVMVFVKKENQIEAYGKILKFLDQYLGYEEAVKD